MTFCDHNVISMSDTGRYKFMIIDKYISPYCTRIAPWGTQISLNKYEEKHPQYRTHCILPMRNPFSKASKLNFTPRHSWKNYIRAHSITWLAEVKQQRLDANGILLVQCICYIRCELYQGVCGDGSVGTLVCQAWQGLPQILWDDFLWDRAQVKLEAYKVHFLEHLHRYSLK